MDSNFDVVLLKACRICNSELIDFFHYENVPIAGTYLTQADLGSEPLLPLTAALCSNCGLIQLREIVPDSIYTSYRFIGTGSASYRAYIDQVVASLISEQGIRDKKVIEIGCNDGYLMKRLRDKGSNLVFGYEPSFQLQQAYQESDIPVARTFFSSDNLGECPILPADVIIIRHVLEHINDLHGFMDAVCSALTDTGVLIIEVPDVDAILSNGLYFHFYHEHLSYFSLFSLEKLFDQYGFQISMHKRVSIHGGSLYLVCKRTPRTDTSIMNSIRETNHLEKLCRDFAVDMKTYLGELEMFLKQQRAEGVRFVGFGAAHRTNIVCSLAKITRDQIEYLVDNNHYLHGLFTPGTHLQIYDPIKLCQEPTDAIIIFATSFEEEIVKEQRAIRERGGRFVSLLPKPRYLP